MTRLSVTYARSTATGKRCQRLNQGAKEFLDKPETPELDGITPIFFYVRLAMAQHHISKVCPP
ncbi:MAG TPA: hypothetical protein VFX22_05890 [Candidatus Kapabacteria bacterium]|nr:hypothetical protein [Candidatus Kapabacteria bacterium]